MVFEFSLPPPPLFLPLSPPPPPPPPCLPLSVSITPPPHPPLPFPLPLFFSLRAATWQSPHPTPTAPFLNTVFIAHHASGAHSNGTSALSYKRTSVTGQIARPPRCPREASEASAGQSDPPSALSISPCPDVIVSEGERPLGDTA